IRRSAISPTRALARQSGTQDCPCDWAIRGVPVLCERVLGKDMIMKKAILVTLAGLIACPCAVGGYQQPRSGATAQEPKAADQLPSVDQILNRYVQAIGGKAAIERLNSLILTGTMEVQAAGLTGKAELIARAPNKYVLKVDIAGIGTFTQAYDGTAG